MPLLAKLFGAHAGNLERAMSRTTQRQGLLAANLANVNVPHYKRRDIPFGIVLDGVQGRGTDRASGPFRRMPERLRWSEGSVRIDGNSVDLEQEVVALAETELRYQALADMAGRYFSGLKNVIREGR